MTPAHFFQCLSRDAQAGSRAVLALITRARGSSPQKGGAKALFYDDGTILGTLGGGCLEAEVQQRAVAALATGRPERFDLVLDHDFGWDDGLVCGGRVEGLILPQALGQGAALWPMLARRERPISWGVRADHTIALAPEEGHGEPDANAWLYRETVRPPVVLWIAGAGHIAQAVAPLARQLDFDVTVFDDRPALCHPRYFPEDVALRADRWERLLAMELPKGRSAFGLIVTRGHRHDALVLRHWVRQPFAFLGMIGSRRKARTILDHFRSENLACAEELARLSCPVGLDIGSQTVPEIAVSIAAQLIQKRAEHSHEDIDSQPSRAERGSMVGARS